VIARLNQNSRFRNAPVSLRLWGLRVVIGITLMLRNDCAGAWPNWFISPFYVAAQEYIIVRVKDQPQTRVPVLINGVKSGTTGELITLGSPGWVFISVDLPKAKQRKLDVTNTTATHPMLVEIDCSSGPADAKL
jgi:hypothetical protein